MEFWIESAVPKSALAAEGEKERGMEGRIYYSQEAEAFAKDRELAHMILAFAAGIGFGVLLIWLFAPRG